MPSGITLSLIATQDSSFISIIKLYLFFTKLYWAYLKTNFIKSGLYNGK